MKITYTIKDEQAEFTPGYGQSFPGMVGMDPVLVSRIWKKETRLGMRISDNVVDIIEKCGMAHLDKAFIEQTSGRDTISQELIKLHLYHWLYDCMATLDAVACLLNLKYEVMTHQKNVYMCRNFIGSLERKNPTVSTILLDRISWIEELKVMRNTVIHREGRLIVGGGTEPAVVIDFKRGLVKELPLHRRRIQELTDEYTGLLDEFVEKILTEVDKW